MVRDVGPEYERKYEYLCHLEIYSKQFNYCKFQILVRNTENSLDQLNKQHKQQTDRMADNHASELKNTHKKTKQDQVTI